MRLGCAAPGGLAVVLVLALAGCGLKSAQDYVATGTLTVPVQLRSLSRPQPGSELIMTVRTSPDVGDVVVQRRWYEPTFPFEFGLGKNRAAQLKERGVTEVYLTAEYRSERGSLLLGWTEAPVPTGSYHLDLSLAHRAGVESNLEIEGYPFGGFESMAVREEGVAPGKVAMSPGQRVFSGRIEVPEGFEGRLRGARLILTAGDTADGLSEDLYLNVPATTFPRGFSLHQNHRRTDDAATNPVMTPKYVTARLDVDGQIATIEDQAFVGTVEVVKPGLRNLTFAFAAEDLERIEEILARKSPGATPRNQGTMPPGHGGGAMGRRPPNDSTHNAGAVRRPTGDMLPNGASLAKGKISLPEKLAAMAEGAELWIMLTDPEGEMFDAYRMRGVSFPHEFDLPNGEGLMQTPIAAERPFRVKVKLTKSGPVAKDVPTALSDVMKPGAEGVSLELLMPIGQGN